MKILKSAMALALSIFMLALCACGAKPTEQKPEKIRDLMADIDVDRISADKISEAEYAALMKAYVSLFGATLSEKKESSLISPLSILTAFGMLADGTAGESRAQLEKLFGLTTNELDTVLSFLTSRLYDTGSEKVKFSSANSLWLTNDGTVKFRTSYLERVKAAYEPSVYSVNFADPAIVNEINSWVKRNTNDMIEKIIEPSDVDDMTVMAIINALTFDGKWAQSFGKVNDGTFTSYLGNAQSAKMMISTESAYIEMKNAVGFMKDYDGGKFRFVALLPDEKTDVFDFVLGLDGDTLAEALMNVSSEEVATAVPKFTLDYDADLIPAMISLGVTDVFGGAADFSELAELNRGDIYVDKAIHKTHIEIDENGTKAAAATYIGTRKNAVAGPEKKVELDRPFVYMILDGETNLPVFMGVLTSVK